MTAEQRAKRDIRVLDMFLAGATYRQIATAVGLKSHSAVHNIITRELQKSAVRRGLLTTNAAAVLIERTEALYRANVTNALRGDYKAAVICDRMLARQSRLFGLDAAGGAMPPTNDPDDPVGEDDEEGGDELAQFRRRRSRGA